MALTATQKVTVAEIVLESLATVETAASSLTAEQETSIGVDIILWGTIRNSHVKLNGQVDFDNARKRAGIFYRIRNMLGLPFVLFYELNTQEAFQLIELEVGGNFG